MRRRADGGPAIVRAEPGARSWRSWCRGTRGGDCAHFASCCVGAAGGGLALAARDAPPAYSLVSATGLVRFLTRAGGRAWVSEGPWRDNNPAHTRAWDSDGSNIHVEFAVSPDA